MSCRKAALVTPESSPEMLSLSSQTLFPVFSAVEFLIDFLPIL